MAYTTIDNPELYFQTKLFTGTGSSNSVTLDGSENMRPDWVWIKNRDSGSLGSQLHDVIRGTTKRLFSNSTDAEETDANGLTAFNSNGFTLGSNVGVNQSSSNMVAWNWSAGGSASSNSDGSITSSVSVNQTAGFSVVSYTGGGANATVGHGLGVAPKVVLIKQRTDAGYNWVFGSDALTSWAYILKLNLTDAEATGSGPQSCFNSTAPTSTVFSIGTSHATSGSGDSLIAYCFAEKQGYSKFGKYTGNGNADGPFVYTGFRPAWVLVRNATESSMQWVIHDNKRNTFNVTDKELRPDSSDAEVTQTRFDFVSNGFKVRNSSSYVNRSGETIIYLAFAEAPFVTAGTKAAGTAR